MNKNNAHLYLPLVQALADGKTIQFNQDEDGDWVDINNLTQFNIRPECYRVKPTPVERWIAVFDGSEGINRFSTIHYDDKRKCEIDCESYSCFVKAIKLVQPDES